MILAFSALQAGRSTFLSLAVSGGGSKIILFTSRGYTSKFDWRPLTEKQLDSWGLKYHELIFGKPFADYYIDNKAIDILDWV